MRFHVLGPLDVRSGSGEPVPVTSAKHRALLSLLLLEAGRVVPVDRIIDELWGDAPPPSAQATLQSYVSQLRRLLEPGRGPRESAQLLVTRAPGYALMVRAEDLDAHRLADLVAAAGEATAAAGSGGSDELGGQAERLLEEAISSWRGLPYLDLGDSPQVQAERSRLEELVLTARERRATMWIRRGRSDLAVPELEALVTEHPLREGVWAHLIEALWASGRQGDALAAYRRCARLLRDELGIEPGPQLVALHAAVLRQQLPTTMAGEDAAAGEASPGSASAARPRPAGEAGAGPAGEASARPGEVGQGPGPATYGSGRGPSHDGPAPDRRPLVGRDAERDLIRAALAGSTRGAGGVLVIEGEAGIGKTRLAEEATAIAEAQGWRSAWARCADDAGAPALWPWSRLLEQLDLGELRLSPGADPDQSRFELFRDARGRLQEVSTHAPLLLVLDDIQGADESSLHLLTHFSRHLEGVRVLVVVTVRSVGEQLPDAVHECLSALAREPRALRVRVTGLGEAGVRELLGQLLGAEDGPLAQRIHSRTEGNPFFVREFAQLLRTDSMDSLGSQGGSLAPPLPPSVRDVVSRRLTSLPPETIDLLRLAAVIGQECDLPLLRTASGADAETVLGALEPAVRSGVVVEREPGWEWRLSHALIRETLLAGLSRVEAARLHHAVATTLESRGHRSAIDVGRLAHHYLQAVPVAGPRPAVRYAGLAAEAARSRYAHPEAAELTRRALRLLDLEPAELEGGDLDRERHALLVALATDLLRSGEPQQAQQEVRRALEVGRALGEQDLMAEAAAVWSGVTVWNWRPYGVVDHDLVAVLEDLASACLDDRALHARLLGTLGVELAYSDRPEEGMESAASAVRLARDCDDPPLLGQVLNNYSLAAWGSADRVERRLAATDESLALVGRGLPARTEFCARLHRGPLRLHLGDIDGFDADLEVAARIAETLPGPEVRPLVLYQQTGRALNLGQWEEAEALSLEAFELYQRTNMWGARMCQVLHQFTLRRREGQLGEVVSSLVEVGDQGMPLVQAMAVVAAAEAGDLAEARRLRARWPQTTPVDWTSDSHLVAAAWAQLVLGEDVRDAYVALLPYAGRQVVVGTANASWGSYDLVLSDLAAELGDEVAAARHAQQALAGGEQVRSPWQVREAVARLSVAGVG